MAPSNVRRAEYTQFNPGYFASQSPTVPKPKSPGKTWTSPDYRTDWTVAEQIGSPFQDLGMALGGMPVLNRDTATPSFVPETTSTSGGGGMANLMKLIADQQQSMNTRYTDLNKYLEQFGGQARTNIDEATKLAMERLAGIDPQAAFQFNMINPQVAGVNTEYLRRIGADPSVVDAQRQLSQMMLDQAMNEARQYAGATTSTLDAERAARQAAAALYGQEATGNLDANMLAQQLALQIARDREQKALDEMRLQYGV